MRTRSLVICVALLSALVLVLAITAFAADDPFVGTWKMNIAKSKASGPNMLPKNETIKNEGTDNGLKTNYDGVDADGKAYHVVWSGKYDGKDYPMTGDPTRDMCAGKKVDSNIGEFIYKKAGKEVARFRCTISKDGKTSTCVGKLKDAQGRDATMDVVYERQ